ncbi:uncharacterized protein LOC109703878 isoform X1 [Ananas comosus]|uniref:Uncharacterized protein LOC109703878 isoform X1 n=1 Tax=Ananas comosus TaxID=4615 RepID=A0A6P5EEV8_ANACO|nr:uncharacterized protein LOC109703878 isoform X1 [Ananas comosus]
MVGFFPSRPLPLATLHFVRPLDAAPTPIPSLDGMLGRVHGRPFFRSRHSRYRRFVSAYSFPPVTQMVRIHSPSEPSAGFDFTPAGFNFTSGKQIEQKLLDYNQEAERFRGSSDQFCAFVDVQVPRCSRFMEVIACWGSPSSDSSLSENEAARAAIETLRSELQFDIRDPNYTEKKIISKTYMIVLPKNMKIF